MPNYCTYKMKVVGEKQNVKEFIKIMQADYDYLKMKFDHEKHMGGKVFEANVEEFEQQDTDYYALISGYCVGSVFMCMFEGKYTYYSMLKENYKEKCRSTTVPIESKRLNLDIEFFSEECLIGFQEHYIVKNGSVECNNYVYFSKYCLVEYETKEEAEKDLDVEITDEEWENKENEEWISRGGFDWDFVI